MSISKFALGGLAVTMMAASSLTTAQEFEANVALTSDYTFRGVSQTDEKPAIQGGFDLGFESGLYVGTWSSNVNFGDGTSQELDLYAGYAFDISDSVSLDLGAIYYIYPNEGDALNYWEFTLGASIGDLGLGLVYSPEYFGDGGPDAFILSADYSFPLGENFGLDFHVGYSDADEDNFFGTDNSYVDYSVGVSTSLLALDWSLAWVGTDLDECDACDDRAVLTASKSF